MIWTVLQVALGGAMGAVARYLTGVAVMRSFGPGFPYATMTVNVVGSFIMGCVVVILAETSQTRLAPFLMIGMLGGFTTFSSFSLDAITLYERGEFGAAGVYVITSVVASLGALMLGLWLTRSVLT